MSLRGQIHLQMITNMKSPTPSTAMISTNFIHSVYISWIWLIEYAPPVMIAERQTKMIPIAAHRFAALNIFIATFRLLLGLSF
jgi:uncharacterized membrane protein (DUF485 family)